MNGCYAIRRNQFEKMVCVSLVRPNEGKYRLPIVMPITCIQIERKKNDSYHQTQTMNGIIVYRRLRWSEGIKFRMELQMRSMGAPFS